MENALNPPPLLARAVVLLEAPSIVIGKLAAWLVMPLTLALVYEVVSRYIFNRPTIWAYDMTYMLAGTLFMLGTPIALQQGAHVRLDFVLSSLKPRWQALVDLVLYLVVYFPAIYIFFTIGYAFAAQSWAQHETMPTSAWSPAIYPLKTVIPVTLFLLLVQGVAEVLKAAWTVRSNAPYPQAGKE